MAILVSIGDVETNAPFGMKCVNVETLLSVMKNYPAIIAAPTPTAHGAMARSHVPEAGCWRPLRLVRTAIVTPAMTPPCIWIITALASRVLARRHAGQ